jgi:hypothetical protein
MDDEAAQGCSERFGGGKEMGIGEESLAGNFLIDASL